MNFTALLILCILFFFDPQDLAFNRIYALPAPSFWAALPALETLYLHHNEITLLDHALSLAGCPRLKILTLHGNPLCHVAGYRATVVNSVGARESDSPRPRAQCTQQALPRRRP